MRGQEGGDKNTFHSKEIKLPYAQMLDDGAAFLLGCDTLCIHVSMNVCMNVV